MKKLFKLYPLILGVVICNYAFAVTSNTINFKNQRGSTMKLIWKEDLKNTGTLSGTFITAVGNCKKDMGVEMPLTGYFNGNAIALTVNFPHCNQVVSITGNISEDKNTINTLWLDTVASSDPSGKNWNSNIIGYDSYQKIE